MLLMAPTNTIASGGVVKWFVGIMLKNFIYFKEHSAIIRQLARWFVLIAPLAIAVGCMVALFLWLLQLSIHFRFNHSWLLFLLPLAGLFIHYIYQSIGKSAEKGNNLIIEQIHMDGGVVPKRMAPIILITTLITHLFGGSAGREGTAVQIGGSIASMFNSGFKLETADRKIMLTAGIAAGFGAVFGTPVTGAIFALEVLAIGKIKYHALLPALIASVLADATVSAWQIKHVHYHINSISPGNDFFSNTLHFDLYLTIKIVIASAAFGLASYLFTGMVNEVKVVSIKLFKFKWMIPVFGGLIIIGLTQLLGKPDYLSLGVDPEYPTAVTLQSAFNPGGAHTWSWLWKSIYTAITLGTGFKGGEVTPLFYIGATLGNTLSQILNAPVSLFAALGFIAVFAGATNTPLACTMMGVELFGGAHVLFFAIACFVAYLFSGHTGIYSAQQIAVPKFLDKEHALESNLAEVAKRKGYLHEKVFKYL
jgi:H+/Cl- antiporter ClcA